MGAAPSNMMMPPAQLPFAPAMASMSAVPSVPMMPAFPPMGGDMFNRGFYPSVPAYSSPNPMMAWSTPFLSPFQQLQDLYFQTMNGWLRARSAWSEAEHAKMLAEQEQTGAELLKQNYLSLGKQLEADAKASIPEQKPLPPQVPFNQAINFPPASAPQLPPALPPAPVLSLPPSLPPMLPSSQPSLPKENPSPFISPQAQNPPPLPLPPAPLPIPQAASPQALAALLAQPTTAQNYDDKQKVLQQIGSQGPERMTPEVLDAVKRLVLQPMPDDMAAAFGIAKPQAEALREQGLWAMGLLGGSYPKDFDTNSLPGLGVIEQVLSNSQESPAIRAAAIQALRAIDRPGDPRIGIDIAKAEEIAQHDTSPEVRDQVAKAKSGMPLLAPSIGLPNPFESTIPTVPAPAH